MGFVEHLVLFRRPADLLLSRRVVEVDMGIDEMFDGLNIGSGYLGSDQDEEEYLAEVHVKKR